jgi:hypothetical protein
VFLFQKFLDKPASAEETHQKEECVENIQLRLREYEACLQQVERLESNIWQSAGLLGVSSATGLIAVAGKITESHVLVGAVLAVAVLAISASMVWLRFARRWSSILDVKFKRMREIENGVGFLQNVSVVERDKEVQSHLLYQRTEGRLRRRLWVRLWYRLPTDIEAAQAKQGVDNYEVRGNRPVIELFVITNLLVWCGTALYAAHLEGRMAVVSLVLSAVLLLNICFWRIL